MNCLHLLHVQREKYTFLRKNNSLDFTATFPETTVIQVLQKEGTSLRFSLSRNLPTSKAASCAIIHTDYLKKQVTYKNAP